MAAKKAKCERRGVSQGKCEASGRIVLVGIYRGDQLTKWRGWYNYPIYDEDFSRVERVDRVDGEREAGNGRARTPAAPKPHGTHYALFKTHLLYRHKGEVPADAKRVIIRTADFAKRSPKIARQLKAYLESPDRNDPDLAKRLPEIITRLRPDQLRVCEAAVQMDLLQWGSAVGMSPLLGKIESIVMSIGELGRAYSLSSSDAMDSARAMASAVTRRQGEGIKTISVFEFDIDDLIIGSPGSAKGRGFVSMAEEFGVA